MKFYYRILDELRNEEKSFKNIYSKVFSFKEAVMFEKNENMLIVDLDTEELQKYREETTEKAYRYYPSKARNELYL